MSKHGMSQAEEKRRLTEFLRGRKAVQSWSRFVDFRKPGKKKVGK